MRQLDAEVLIDALCWIGGDGESYSSPIPEPYTFIPKDQRTIALADGSITSSFLTTFGRPARDTGLESERSNQPTDTQRLYMLNSSDVQRRIDRSPRLQDGGQISVGGIEPAMIRRIYLIILSRYPTPAETSHRQSNTSRPRDCSRDRPSSDLAWALINSKEFLYRH